jgi:hypothetical protein
MWGGIAHYKDLRWEDSIREDVREIDFEVVKCEVAG